MRHVSTLILPFAVGCLAVGCLAFGCQSTDVVLVPSSDAGSGPLGPDAGPPAVPGLLSLRVDPLTARVIDDGRAPGETATFRAFGAFHTGEEEVTDRVAWSLEDPRFGAIDGGRFTSASLGGRTRVRVQSGTVAASAELNVDLEVIGLAPGAPADAPARFPADVGSDTSGAGAPEIVYPSDRTFFPRNVRHVLYQWHADPPLDLFELRFESAVATVRWFTSERSLALDEESRRFIAATHAGGSVEISVRAVSRAAPLSTRPARSPRVLIHFSSEDVTGVFTFWSTRTQGLSRATLESRLGSKFYTDPTTEDRGQCVACHTVSRDGRRIAMAYRGRDIRVIGAADRRPVTVPNDGDASRYGWGSFDPTGTRIVYGHDGQLRVLSLDTGGAPVDVVLPVGRWATHPDWSPDGRAIAVAYVALEHPDDKEIKESGSSLARIPVLGDGSFGAPEVLVQSTGVEDIISFPSYSPDGRFIAFSRARGRSSRENRSAELFLVRADGTGGPIALRRLNRVVKNQDAVISIGNTMPTWGPTGAGGIDWLMFSSVRDYGDVQVGPQHDQLWAAAIDLRRAGTGDDPSFAAFWLPFQQLGESNHRAFWTPSSEACVPLPEVCDGFDDDCDGVTDDGCCTPSVEVCGDAADNDCDGAADEGCGCAAMESCLNGVDDDCDGDVDRDDSECDD